MNIIVIFALIVLGFLSVDIVLAQKKSDASSRHIDEKVKGLDESTRRRILAMQQAGMPSEAIAKKIQYEVGNSGVARKVLEKINVDEQKKTWASKQRQRLEVKKSVKMQEINEAKKFDRFRR
jgi:hypothetical protein